MGMKTIRINEEDWVWLSELQARRARQSKERPSFADLISEIRQALGDSWA